MVTRPNVAAPREKTTLLVRLAHLSIGGVASVSSGSVGDLTQSADLRPAIRVAAVAFVTALTAAAAQISVPLPFTPVPFTFQPMVVLLGGAVLGARLGFISQVVYLWLGVAGLPVFATSAVLPQSLGRLLGPTGGYLLSFPFAAFVTGTLAERGWDRRYLGSLAAMSCGLLVIFTGGVAWLAFWSRPLIPSLSPWARLSQAIALGVSPFILPDLIKLCLAAAVLPGLWRLTGFRAGRH